MFECLLIAIYILDIYINREGGREREREREKHVNARECISMYKQIVYTKVPRNVFIVHMELSAQMSHKVFRHLAAIIKANLNHPHTR